MINLTSYFQDARARKSIRSTSDFRILLFKVRESLQGVRIEWDEGAGENWATVFTDGDNISAIVRKDAPLAIVTGEAGERVANIAEAVGFVTIRVHNFDNDNYCLDRSVVEDSFSDWTWRLGPAVDLKHFSISELWWATI